MQHKKTDKTDKTENETSSSIRQRKLYELLRETTEQYCDIPTFSQISLVCRGWNMFFYSSYLTKIQIKISELFGIDLALLKSVSSQFSREFDRREITVLQTIYQHLLRLKKRAPLLDKGGHNFFQLFYTRPSNHAALLACCTDNPTYFFRSLLPEHWLLWEQLAIAAGCNTIAMAFYHETKDKISIIKIAAAVLNLELLLEIKKQAHGDQSLINMDLDIIYCAAALGDLERIRSIFESMSAQSLQQFFSRNGRDDTLLNNALLSDNDPLLHYLIEALQREEPDAVNTLIISAASKGSLQSLRLLISRTKLNLRNALLPAAISGDNPELIHFLVIEHQYGMNENAKTQYELVASAIKRRHTKVALYLLTNNPFNITPDEQMLQDATSYNVLQLPDDADRDSLETLSCLLSPQFHLRNALEKDPTKCYSLLHRAAASGYLRVVTYLVQTFDLSPDEETRHQAVLSCNPKLIQYFLTPGNSLPKEWFAEALLGEGILSIEFITLLTSVYPLHSLKLNIDEKEVLLKKAISSAHTRGDFEVLYYFLTNSFFMCPPQSFQLEGSLGRVLRERAEQFSKKRTYEKSFKEDPSLYEAMQILPGFAQNSIMLVINKILLSVGFSYALFSQLLLYDTAIFQESEAKKNLYRIFHHSFAHFHYALNYICNTSLFSEAKQFVINETRGLLDCQNLSSIEKEHLQRVLAELTSPLAPEKPERGEKRIREEKTKEGNKKDGPDFKRNKGP